MLYFFDVDVLKGLLFTLSSYEQVFAYLLISVKQKKSISFIKLIGELSNAEV